MIAVLFLLAGVAIGVGVSRAYGDVARELEKATQEREVNELAAEIKRQREQISRLIGVER